MYSREAGKNHNNKIYSVFVQSTLKFCFQPSNCLFSFLFLWLQVFRHCVVKYAFGKLVTSQLDYFMCLDLLYLYRKMDETQSA